MEFLWTDKCFLVLLALSLITWLLALRKKHNRELCQRIFKKPLALVAALMLLFFLIIGVLDSIHLTTPSNHAADSSLLAQQNNSLLDKLLAPLGSFYEKTYSAPFALNLYTAETIFEEGYLQVYSRLGYPSTAIKTKVDIKERIFRALERALGFSLLFILLSGLCLYFFKSNRSWRCTQSQLVFLLTIGSCSFIALASYWLSRDFHILGTGKIGEDIFYYSIKSIHTGLMIGILTTLIMLPLALLLGVLAGYFGGWVDDIIQYIYTTLSSIPGVLLIVASILSMQTYIANHPKLFPTLAQAADARLFALCIILGITSWTNLCRLIRAETLKLREIDYVLAARSLGSGWFIILRKHLLPNLMPLILITVVLDFSFLVLAEAVLSYVGVGVSPTTISWGNMINGARLELAREPLVWWPIMAAFLGMFSLVLASNIFADAVRDGLDSRN